MKKVIINNVESEYLVDELGNVYSNKFERMNILRYNNIRGGYKMCHMYLNGIKQSILVHRVVAEAFIPNPLNKPQVNHKNGIKTDNRAENLEWVTQSENIKHAYDNKLMIKTHKECWNALLDENQVHEIRLLINKKIKQREIAKSYNVSEQTISSIKHNRIYIGIGLDESEYIKKQSVI